VTLHITQFVTEVLVPLSEVPPPPTVTPRVETARFDARGGGSSWYLVPQLSDGGVELRPKTVKAFRATGKMTSPQFSVYGYRPQEPIVVSDIEDGINSTTPKIPLPTTTDVEVYARTPIDVAGAMVYTWRLEGTWDGVGDPDRVDEVICELAVQGGRL
jgi:hypothetical protein